MEFHLTVGFSPAGVGVTFFGAKKVTKETWPWPLRPSAALAASLFLWAVLTRHPCRERTKLHILCNLPGKSLSLGSA